MADLGNITSANATLAFSVQDVIPNAVILEGFSTDAMYGIDEITFAETRMGVDGNLAAGWVPSVWPIQIDLEACSPSLIYMQMLQRASEANRTVYKCTLVITVPSIRKIYTFTNGILKSGTPVASAKKVLDPTTWKFEFPAPQIVDY